MNNPLGTDAGGSFNKTTAHTSTASKIKSIITHRIFFMYETRKTLILFMENRR